MDYLLVVVLGFDDAKFFGKTVTTTVESIFYRTVFIN